MCTLIAFHRCAADAPLVVAANRDEFHERPTEGPALRERASEGACEASEGAHAGAIGAKGGRVVAPRDLRAGGTWLGINADGLFAAVTNRRAEHPDPERRSRGWLVMEALAAPDAKSAADRLEGVAHAAYNPFNLFVADAETAHWVTYEDRPERRDLPPGPHVIGNVHPDEASPKLVRLRDEVGAIAATGASLDALAAVCRRHVDGSPVESTCVHAGPYGTRSSTLLRLGADPVLRYADGPPCEAPYRDLTPLLRDLGILPSRVGVQARGMNT